MRSNLVVGIALMALSAFADKAHDCFNAHRDEVLSHGISVFDGYAYIVGRADSPRNRGDTVGWTKAEEAAKWNLGDRHRTAAPWPQGVTEDEKSLAWLEYRSSHANRFHVIGMQRVWTKKRPPERYEVVLAVPLQFVSLNPPTAEELESAVHAVREKKRRAEEAALRASEEAARKAKLEAERKKAEAEAAERKAGARKILPGGAVRQQQLDEDMVF